MPSQLQVSTTTQGSGCSRNEQYYFEPNKLQNNGIEDYSEVENCLDKMDFADLVKDAKSVAGFSPCRKFRVGPNDVT